jgi:hypothetical protein
MKLYENIVIGSFLFELGVRMAKRRPDLPLISTNLLQQTPMDGPLADVLLANAAMCRLIEFKRKANKSTKELQKRQSLEQSLLRSKNSAKALEISRRSHWLIGIDDKDISNTLFNAHAVPYIDFVRETTSFTLSAFADKTAAEACGAPDPVLAEWNQRYLRFIAKYYRESIATSGSSALLVAFSEQSQLLWIAVPDIGYLFMESQELQQSLGIEIQSRGKSPGYSYGV